jgi:uncharacterized membrane protein (UPF0127 family)
MATAMARNTAALAAVAILSALATGAGASERCAVRFDSGVSISLPVARTLAQQAKGLSGTANVAQGMLFIWDNAEPRAIWMKDTHVDLSVAFVDSQNLLFGVEDMIAGEKSYHLSMTPAKAALELPKGGFARLGISNGNRIISLRCTAMGGNDAERK